MGGRRGLIRNPSKAFLPCLKAIGDVSFLLMELSQLGALSKPGEGPLIHSFIFWYRQYLMFIALWNARKLITQKGCAPRSLHSGKG